MTYEQSNEKVKSLSPQIKDLMAMEYLRFKEENPNHLVVSQTLACMIKQSNEDGERELLIDLNILLNSLEQEYIGG